jgi:predicted dienelactone hydrolase
MDLAPLLIRFLSVSLGILLAACTPRSGLSKFAARGRFAVGTCERTIKDNRQAPVVRATLWYPALNRSKSEETIIYQGATEGIGTLGQAAPVKGHALADAAPDPSGGIYPLVVFSTCRGRGRMLYSPILEAWASHGFIVMALGSTAGAADCLSRVQEVSRAIDFAESLASGNDPFAGLIDLDKVAVAGHCDGAFTALLSGGARIDTMAASALCQAGVPHTVECQAVLSEMGRKTLARSAGLPREPPDGRYPAVADPRVKALIPMAAGGELEASSDLASIRIPVLLAAGSSDRHRPLWGVERVYQNLSIPCKSKLILAGGGHDLFCIAASDVAVATDVGGLEPGLWNAHQAHDVINHFTTAFLLDVLKGDPEAREAMRPGAAAFERVHYSTTWK